MVRRTIKVKKKVGRQDQALPKDLLTHIIDFVTENTKFFIITVVGLAVVILAAWLFASYRNAEAGDASVLEYTGAELFHQAQAISLSEEGEEAQEALADKMAEREGLLKKALEKFEQLKKEHSGAKNMPRCLFYIGAIRYEMGDNRSAIAAFEECLNEFPDSEYWGFCQANLARTYEQMGDYDAAIQAYQKIVDEPKRTAGMAPHIMDLAELYVKLERPEDAKKVYMDIASLYPGSRWSNEADAALKKMEEGDKPAEAGAPHMGVDMSKLPPGFDPSKVQRVVVGKDKEGKRTIDVEKPGEEKEPASQEPPETD
ncbi:MAG: tetratricopeptide repeat protein [Candidatus Coatesbacteria bacterium]|nr:tetratricopeptide repeat protein [Candidatus Coatesbacteria bacterium]